MVNSRAVRIGFLCVLFVLHSTLLALTGLALISNKASRLEAIQSTIDFLSLVIIIIISVYKYKHRIPRATKPKSNTPNIIAFGSIWLLTLGGSLVLSLPHSGPRNSIVIAISWITSVIALAGMVVSFYDPYAGQAAPHVPDKELYKIQHFPPPPTKHASPKRPSRPTTTPKRLGAGQDTHAYWGSGWFDDEYHGKNAKNGGVKTSRPSNPPPMESGWFDDEPKDVKYPPRAHTKSSKQLKEKKLNMKAPSNRYKAEMQAIAQAQGGVQSSGWY